MPKKESITDFNQIIINTHTEVDQILGNPPNWILRWGMVIVTFSVLIFGILSYIIKYPDIVPAKVTIQTKNPPIRLVAKANGKINQLLIQNNETVTKGQILAIIDNPTNVSDVEKLENNLLQFNTIKVPSDYLKLKFIKHFNLGQLQTSYARLIQKTENYQYFLMQNSVYSKIKSYQERIAYLKKLNQNFEKQQFKLEREVELAKKNYQRNQKLNQSGNTSDVKLEKIESYHLQSQRQLANNQNQIITNQISIEQLQTQILELQQTRKDGHSERELAIQQEFQQLKSEIDIWKKNHLLKSPILGKVSFANIWSEQQFVKSGEEVFTIVPVENVTGITGRAIMPTVGSGKVVVGQTVHIALGGFPYQEYGKVVGTVAEISLVPQESSYLLDINLPEQLITTYGKHIPFKQEMIGIAEIITEDRRVISRIFDKINEILNNT